jgi:hypothetical protein
LAQTGLETNKLKDKRVRMTKVETNGYKVRYGMKSFAQTGLETNELR